MHKHRKHAVHHANHSAANAQFIAQAATAAVQSEIATGTPASITIAQAILESGWGNHHIGSANNYFGVKAQKKGDDVTWGTIATGYVDVNTREHFKGKDVTLAQPFRSYTTMEDSFTDHGQVLANNGRYRQYLKDYATNGDARAFARGLQKAGYATDPKYAELLIGLIDKYKLDQYDIKQPAAATAAPSAPASAPVRRGP